MMSFFDNLLFTVLLYAKFFELLFFFCEKFQSNIDSLILVDFIL